MTNIWRFALLLLAICVWPVGAGAGGHDWPTFKRSFISEQGQLLDKQQGISHSEGQGYGLILAWYHDDHTSFATLWQWTQRHLQQPDQLLAWSYGPDKNGQWQIRDSNNATDGDLLVALALLKGYERWHIDHYKQAALAMVKAIRDKLTVHIGTRQFLLPGKRGFVDDNSVRLNPSYQIWSAFDTFAQYDDPTYWRQISKDAHWLTEQSFERNTRLPSNWIWLSKDQGQLKKRSLYGYDAIRVYLYPLWTEQPLRWQPTEIARRVEHNLPIFSEYDFDKATQSAPYLALAGITEVYCAVYKRLKQPQLANKFQQLADSKRSQEPDYYYSQVLSLLTQVRL